MSTVSRKGSVTATTGTTRRGSATSSKATASSPKDSGNIQVAVRCRPISADEKKQKTPTVVTCDMEKATIKIAATPGAGGKATAPRQFHYDKVFGMYSRQDEIFEQMIKPVVDEAMEGYNCTVFAYGPTGTGKTHTIEGNVDDPDLRGLIPRTADWVFDSLSAAGSDFAVKVSYLEICKSQCTTTTTTA